MPRYEIDLNPVQHITSDAIGQPGQRVFYIQGWRETDIQPVTVVIEKVQLQTLAAGLEQMLTEIARQNPALVEFRRSMMQIKCTSPHQWIQSSAPGKWVWDMMPTRT